MAIKKKSVTKDEFNIYADIKLRMDPGDDEAILLHGEIDTKLRKILDEMFDSNIDYSVGYNSIKREEYIVLLNQAINQFNT